MPGNDIMSMNSTNSPGSLNRRRFLARTGLGLAATQFLSVPLWGANAPGNRLNIAGIGIGSRGGSDVDAMAQEKQNIVALCDVDSKYAAKKFQQYSKATVEGGGVPITQLTLPILKPGLPVKG